MDREKRRGSKAARPRMLDRTVPVSMRLAINRRGRMLCSVCKRHSTKNKYNKTTAWSESPCICLRKDSVRRNASSVQHSNAVGSLKRCEWLPNEREGSLRPLRLKY